MSAALLSNFVAGGDFRIELVESEAIGTVGVGEATIPQINLYNQALGIDEDEFLAATQGSYKLGIEFVDWSRRGHRYMHAFGEVGRDIGVVPFHHYWHRARELGLAGELAAYSLNETAARAGRMQRGPLKTTNVVPPMPYAFHFDASLYAAYLRRLAEQRGVVRREGRIVSVERDGESGDVTEVRLESGEAIAADLFLDCSGFRGLLIEETLSTGFHDWSNWLPCDRALAVPCAAAAELTPYTRSTALEAGWQWRIPLQHRTGNGHVYCSGFTSDEAAAELLLAGLDGEALAEPRPLRFTAGMRRKAWNHNVIAVGLASGFLEPLESTSIHLVQSALSRLVKMLPRGKGDAAVAAEFNRQAAEEYESIRDFIILHYKATERDDSAFWRHCAAMPIPDSLAERISLFREAGHIFRRGEELFTVVGWLQVLVGQGVLPASHHPLADHVEPADLESYMQTFEALMRREAAQMPRHADFIARHGAAQAA
ncbi:tryptophan 7-halogenase [Sphingomonas ginkgonis]|uniref:Tryptophan 7-halogenase n=2 Tax=Sphingomonas ginkgonis TaxID=2315330 RepID=A0A3S0EPE8_9SPHN|nr:tryptophan 7-halogenase [Sphingomonas ginkgonis]